MNDEQGRPKRRWVGCCLVPSIIFILIFPLLFRALARAECNAQRTACLNNLKQIGIAISMYAQDWDNKLPPFSGFGPELDNHKILWGAGGDIYNKLGSKRKYMPEFIGPYIKNQKMFICPAIGDQATWQVLDSQVDLGKNKTSYIFNAWCRTDDTKTPLGGCTVIAGSDFDKCPRPREAPIAWDSISGFSSSGQLETAHQITRYLYFDRQCIDVLYMDMHIEAVDLDAGNLPFSAKDSQGHFWGAPDPKNPRRTLGAQGWY